MSNHFSDVDIAHLTELSAGYSQQLLEEVNEMLTDPELTQRRRNTLNRERERLLMLYHKCAGHPYQEKSTAGDKSDGESQEEFES